MSSRVITVAAAVIVREGKILIGQRPLGEWGALKWEFPGGKLEPGEDSATALKRELREELEIEAEIEPAVEQTDFQYADTPPVRLIFHPVLRFEGEPRNLAFAQIVWESPERLESYDFLEADKPFVRALANGEAKIDGLAR